MSEKIFLGVVTLEDGEAVALDLPVDGSVEDIKNAISRANLERIEATARESERLRAMFLDTTVDEAGK